MNQPPTLNQFRDKKAREISADYGVSIAEATYGIGSYDAEWKSECESYAKSGGVFSKRWLNACGPDWRYCLRKWYPESIPSGYVDRACLPA